MDEKILVSSEHYNLKKIFRIIIIVTLLVTIGLIISYVLDIISYCAQLYDDKSFYETEEYTTYLAHQKEGRCDRYMKPGWKCSECYNVERTLNFIEEYPTKNEYIRSYFDELWSPITKHVTNNYLIPSIAIIIIIGLVQLWLRSYKLTVTDKRIYGTIVLGRRVDLPVDSVSAVSTIGLLKGISIASSSGRISFLFIKNTNEIYEQVNNLLIERQAKVSVPVTSIKQEIPRSNAEELKKFKELHDMGIITQEEFDTKKKQLLGL